jgi:hypothetical protein
VNGEERQRKREGGFTAKVAFTTVGMDSWSYQPKKFYDRKGGRWHFIFHSQWIDGRAPGEHPYALYFRDDERTTFGDLVGRGQQESLEREIATACRRQ